MTRTSTFSVRSAPSGSNSRSCSTRSSLACSAGLIVPISSRKIVPPSASANLPFLVSVAPVNAPRTWPKSSDSSSVSGIAAQFTLMSGMSRCGAAVVDRARDQLLAGAGLAGDEHRALGLGDELGAADHVLHRPAAADDAVVVELLVALAEQVAVARCAAAGARARGGRRPAARRSRTASAGSRARRASSPRSRSRPSRGPSSSGSAGARPRASTSTYSRIRSRPLELRHHVVDQRAGRRRGRRAAAGPRGRVAVDGDLVAGVAQRAAERLQDLLFVVDEQDRAVLLVSCVSSRSRAAGRRQIDAELGAAARARWRRRSCRRAPRRCSWRWPGPRPVPPRLVVKNGSNTRGSRSRDRCRRRGRRRRSSCRRGRAAVAERRRAARRRPRPAGRRPARAATACRALVSRFTSAIRSRSAIGRHRRRLRGRGRGGPVAPSPARTDAAADSRQSAFRSTVDQLEADRPREVEHLVHDPVQPRHLLVDVGDRLADARRRSRPAGAARAATP